MAVNDNWHLCPGRACDHGEAYSLLSPPLQPQPVLASPRCPATTRHTLRYCAEMVGLQCHFEPGHDGDHAAYAGPGEGDLFWPQEVTAELIS